MPKNIFQSRRDYPLRHILPQLLGQPAPGVNITNLQIPPVGDLARSGQEEVGPIDGRYAQTSGDGLVPGRSDYQRAISWMPPAKLKQAP